MAAQERASIHPIVRIGTGIYSNGEMKGAANHMTKVTYALAVAAVIVASNIVVSPVRAADTDDRIEATAKKTYVFRTQLKDDSIKIESNDGAVTLTGTVADESHKSLAEDTVKGLPGVQSVVDRLEVSAQPPAEKSDGWIVTKVKMALLFHRSVSALTQVDAKDGVVTLRGTADSQAEKDLTTQYARDIDGVTRVDNEMTVNTQPPSGTTTGEKIDDASITAQVKFALLQHRSTSALRTQVKTTRGVVILHGNAKNQAEIDLVTKLVEDINGVKNVKNEMTVQG
jgi:hyperosmotically inducible periplasmic protein